MVWTSERVKKLIAMINERGMSMGAAAAELGDTRNAAIGKVTRLKAKGVKIDVNPIGIRLQRFKKWKPASAQLAFRERCGEINKKKFKAVTPSGAVRDVTANSRVGRIVLSTNPAKFSQSMAIAVLTLRHDQCRWPLGEGEDFKFCDAQQLEGCPYCAAHTSQSFHCNEVRIES